MFFIFACTDDSGGGVTLHEVVSVSIVRWSRGNLFPKVPLNETALQGPAVSRKAGDLVVPRDVLHKPLRVNGDRSFFQLPGSNVSTNVVFVFYYNLNRLLILIA